MTLPGFQHNSPPSQRQLAIRTHPAFFHLLPRPCPRPPSTFRTRDCLARKSSGLQQVLGEKLPWTTFLRDAPLFPFTWELLNTNNYDIVSPFLLALDF